MNVEPEKKLTHCRRCGSSAWTTIDYKGTAIVAKCTQCDKFEPVYRVDESVIKKDPMNNLQQICNVFGVHFPTPDKEASIPFARFYEPTGKVYCQSPWRCPVRSGSGHFGCEFQKEAGKRTICKNSEAALKALEGTKED